MLTSFIFSTFSTSNLFQTCVFPSVWKKAIITTVTKVSSKDPHVSINYRTISLLSCVVKAFSCIINKHVVNYCEDNNIYEDEQNGFQKKRLHEDHILVLTYIIKNRMSENKETFCSCIDMQKALDLVNIRYVVLQIVRF